MASTTIDSDMRALLEWVFVNGLDEDNHREGEVVADGIMASFDAA